MSKNSLNTVVKHMLQNNQSQQQPQIYSKMEVPPQKSSDSTSSSLTYTGGTIKNALGEGLKIMENKTVDIIQETKKLHIRKRGGSQTEHNQALNKTSPKSFPQIQADYETQLKASCDVAAAMAAKAKLLMREMKTVKADLAFAKERCTQLEEENKVLREGLEKGSNPEDDDLGLYIRSRFIINVNKVYGIAMRKLLNTSAPILELMGAPPH